MASVSCHPSSYQTYPGGDQIILETECGSIYSLISILIKAFLSLKSSIARAFAVSVFHTHVGPRNKKLQIGLFSSDNQALFLWIASATSLSASSCQTTLLFILSKRCRYLSFSCSTSFHTGIQVHFETISATSSRSTLSLRYESPLFWFSWNSFSMPSISCSTAGISEYLILATAW